MGELTLSFDHIPAVIADAGEHEPFAVHSIVETPAGYRSKYAYHEKFGIMTLTATLRPQLRWPCNFGFIPQTLADDGDPLDIALFLDEPAFPSCLVYARIIGVIGLVKEGVRNDRLAGVMLPERSTVVSTDGIRSFDDLPSGVIDGLETFLRTYTSDGKAAYELTGRGSAADAFELVRRAHERWRMP